MISQTGESLVMKSYFPGVVGRLVELHATYYHEHWGLDITFETQVGRELSEFMSLFRPVRDFFQTVSKDGILAGAITVDSQRNTEEGVRLRWFIVHPDYQGRGIGRLLLKNAIDFCRRAGYKKIFLWTFRGLDAARFLYESAGFALAEENAVTQWGREIREQRFEMILRTESPV